MKIMRAVLFSSMVLLTMPAPVSAATYDEQLAAITKEKEDAEAGVKAIANQPLQSYPVSTYSLLEVASPGWFHGGASTPDYDKVDVRKSQEFPYTKANYVTSDITPGVMYRSGDIEFNKNIKFYYTDRNVPKKKLSEAEMLEINRLYRIIGADIKKLSDMQEFLPSTKAKVMEFFNSAGGTVVELLLVAGIGFLMYRKMFARRR